MRPALSRAACRARTQAACHTFATLAFVHDINACRAAMQRHATWRDAAFVAARQQWCRLLMRPTNALWPFVPPERVDVDA